MKSFTLRRSTATMATTNNSELLISTTRVKTISTKPRQEIDIKNINSINDLQPIKRRDPFMYYSIPGVRSAKVLMKDDSDIDTSNLGASSLKARMRSCTSCPSRIPSTNGRPVYAKNDDWEQQQQQQQEEQSSITRKTCISFECHPDLLLDDELFFDDDLDDDESSFDILAILAGQ